MLTQTQKDLIRSTYVLICSTVRQLQGKSVPAEQFLEGFIQDLDRVIREAKKL